MRWHQGSHIDNPSLPFVFHSKLGNVCVFRQPQESVPACRWTNWVEAVVWLGGLHQAQDQETQKDMPHPWDSLDWGASSFFFQFDGSRNYREFEFWDEGRGRRTCNENNDESDSFWPRVVEEEVGRWGIRKSFMEEVAFQLSIKKSGRIFSPFLPVESHPLSQSHYVTL